MSMGELASAAPTSGGVRDDGIAEQRAKPKHFFCRDSYSFISGLTLILLPSGAISLPGSSVVRCCFCIKHYKLFILSLADSNTIGNIASVASVDWSASVQVMAAATIGSNGSFTATKLQTLSVLWYLLPRSLG